jgi:hypothetical protein
MSWKSPFRRVFDDDWTSCFMRIATESSQQKATR